MVKKLVVAGAVLLAIALISFIVISKRGQGGQSIKIYKDTGTLMYKSSSGEYASINSDEQSISNNSFVKTGADGLAHALLPDGSMISLGEGAEVQINYDAKKIGVLQTLGKAWYRVQKLAGREEFSVETPTTVAVVRGTIFGVERGEEDEIYVTQSSIEISQLKEENGKKIRENGVTLGENKLASVGAIERGLPKIGDLPDEKRQTAWFRRNEIIDKEFTKGTSGDFVKKLHENVEIQKIDEELKLLRVSNSAPGGQSDIFGKFSTSTWLENGAEACAFINSQEYADAINQLKSMGTSLGAWDDWVVGAFNLTSDVCKDNVIDANEAASLQKYYEGAPQPPTFGIPQN